MTGLSMTMSVVLATLTINLPSTSASPSHMQQSASSQSQEAEARDEASIEPHEIEAIFSMLRHPNDCHLTLICLVQSDPDLRNSDFMRGIRYLAGRSDNPHSEGINSALEAGGRGDDCRLLSEACDLSSAELMQAIDEMSLVPEEMAAKKRRRRRREAEVGSYTGPWRNYPDAEHRGYVEDEEYTYTGPVAQKRFGLANFAQKRQSFFENMPPFVRPREARHNRVCRRCDSRRTVCSVYSIGTYVGCTGVWLVSGFPGQIACNVLTTPGSIGCGMNTLNCYMHGCGVVDIPDNLRGMLRNPGK